MENFPQLPRIYDLLGQSNGRNPPVIVPYCILYSGLFYGGHHLLSFFHRSCERLFTKDHFACFRSGNGDFGMFVIGGTDIDGIYVVSCDDGSPVSLCVFVAPLFGKSFYFVLSPGTSDLKNGTVFHFWKKVSQSFITIGMDPAHQSGSNKSYSYLFFIFHWC